MPLCLLSCLQILLLTLDKVDITTPYCYEVDNFTTTSISWCVYCNIITFTGSPPSKVYGHMRAVAGKLSERF